MTFTYITATAANTLGTQRATTEQDGAEICKMKSPDEKFSEDNYIIHLFPSTRALYLSILHIT